ncbi:MAG: phenylpyruvate tautomerase MIF-related protein [Clostridia bacterium]|nr:phenylpyruvate tautomerase MIF-related protein [Clostridia bacterium]
MPFIDSKVTVKMTDAQKEEVKSALGAALPVLHKPESYLMVGIEDGYDLWFAGKRLEKGAYVSVSLFGEAGSDAYNRMTAEICRIYGEVLGIPGNRIYVTYHGVNDWGWNGSNF